ncbi:retrotransposon protein, putative, ty1-copia subclass [Tanacetum coccineum]|uniref:Retrotransposon protein, putative, ty1-copia subclass n=1 Tax=Tanacetum coccineum TaxID=301880 RepID=A0ABQ5BPE0_9ASTR
MTTLKFPATYNMVAFLEKPTECAGFEEILDFLNANPIKYALTVNPTIYVSYAEGVDCLPNATIFEQLTLMGYEKLSQKLTFYKSFFSPQWKFMVHTITQCLSAKTTAWNKFSSIMAFVIICLATNQKFNFSKYIFDGMVGNVDNLAGKFLLYLRFVQVFVNQQLKYMPAHEEVYVAPFHTKKVFANMRRDNKGFSGKLTPLFAIMMVQQQADMGEADEAVRKERGDSLVRAATTASSLEVEQDIGNIVKTRSKATPNEFSSLGADSGGGPRCQETMACTFAQTRFEKVSKPSNESPFGGVNTPQSNEDIMQLKELMELYKGKEALRKEKEKNSGFKGLYKGRRITDINTDEGISLVDQTAENQGRFNDEEMFDASMLQGKEVFVEKAVPKKVVEVTNASKPVDAAATTTTTTAAKDLTIDEVTLAQVLAALKSLKPKAKGIMFHEQEEASTPTVSLKQPTHVLKDKGKAKLIKPELPKKKKEQIRIDKELAFKLQDEEEEERLSGEKAQQIDEANVALTEEWNDIQAKIEAHKLLVERLQVREQEELTIEERAKLFQQLLEKMIKFFAAKRADEKRNRPPTRAQQRTIMCTYLKNMEGWKPKSLKNKSFDEIKELFDKAIKWVNTFVDYRTEMVEESSKKAIAEESSLKREDTEMEQEMTTSVGNNSVFRSFFEKQKLTGPNFIDWYRQLRLVLSTEDKENYLEHPIPAAPVAQPGQQVPPKALAAHAAWVKGQKEVDVLMLLTMDLDIQRNLAHLGAYDMLQELKAMFSKQAEQELLFVQNFNMHGMGKTVNELHAMLKLHEEMLPKKDVNHALHAIRAGRGIHGSKKLKPGALSLYVGDGHRAAVEEIETYHLELPSGLVIVLNNCHYAPSITRGVISVLRLFDDGFINRFDDNNVISVSKNNLVYFMAVPRDGIFEIDMSCSNTNDSSMYAITNKRAKINLDSSLLWHCRLGHISKKRIEKLQHDGLLNSIDIESLGKCVSCLSGKMARKPYSHQVERAKDLLGLIHTDVCGPFRIVSRQGASYFVTFTDDFSRYGYVYLLKHKHEVFETFKVFQKEVENQLGKTIKSLRSDRGGEYMSHEFWII